MQAKIVLNISLPVKKNLNFIIDNFKRNDYTDSKLIVF